MKLVETVELYTSRNYVVQILEIILQIMFNNVQ